MQTWISHILSLDLPSSFIGQKSSFIYRDFYCICCLFFPSFHSFLLKQISSTSIWTSLFHPHHHYNTFQYLRCFFAAQRYPGPSSSIDSFCMSKPYESCFGCFFYICSYIFIMFMLSITISFLIFFSLDFAQPYYKKSITVAVNLLLLVFVVTHTSASYISTR